MTSTADAIIAAVLADPLDSTARGALRDCLQEADRWTWPEVRALVLAHPESDGPRLLAATWIEEAGELERAEFIRVQCELARWQAEPAETALSRDGQDRHWDIRSRMLALWHTNGCRWLPDVAGITQTDVRDGHHAHLGVNGSLYGSGHESHPGRIDCVFRRGFLDAVTLSATDLLVHAGAILADHPVQTVTLTTEPELEVAGLREIGGASSPVRVRFPGFTRSDYRRDEEGWLGVCGRLLKAEWPRVKTWYLPATEYGESSLRRVMHSYQAAQDLGLTLSRSHIADLIGGPSD